MTAPIHLFDRVESTNDLALAAARDGAKSGEAWLADLQTAGRGRREVGGERRSWHSPAGQSIYLSVVVRPSLQPNDVPNITIASGLEIAHALATATESDIWLKWPNDLMIGDRKVAGILSEGVVGKDGFEAAVVGIGINVHTERADVPAELADTMTSFAIATGKRFDRVTLALATRDAVVEASNKLEESGLSAFSDLLERYDRCAGRKVEVDLADGKKIGIAEGIDADGSLVVSFDGTTEKLRAGEARLVNE